jgi:hypothetical protein
MATNTTNYNLIKPDLTDNVDIGDINANMDTLDTTIKSVSDAIPTVTVNLINTDNDSGNTIYVGSVDPDVSYTPVTGDVWIEVPTP